MTVHNISNSSFEDKIAEQNTEILMTADTGMGVLHLTEPSLHIIDKLRVQCPNGLVHGIETKLTSREFFVIQFYSLNAIGHCTKK